MRMVQVLVALQLEASLLGTEDEAGVAGARESVVVPVLRDGLKVVVRFIAILVAEIVPVTDLDGRERQSRVVRLP